MPSETDFTQVEGNFLDDYLHEVGLSRFSVARGRSLWMIICNHEKEIKNAFFETLHNEIKCVMSIKESNFNENNWFKIFTVAYF